MDYWPVPDYVIEQANDLIAHYHPEIATAQIYYQFKGKASKSDLEKGQVCSVKKIPDVYKSLTGDKDFIITIFADGWNELDETQKLAKLDSALCCCSVKLTNDGEFKLDDSGNAIFVLKSPDLSEFIEIIDRYGTSVLADIGDKLDEIVRREEEVAKEVVSESKPREAKRTKTDS